MKIYPNLNCNKVRGSHVLLVSCAYCKTFIAHYNTKPAPEILEMFGGVSNGHFSQISAMFTDFVNSGGRYNNFSGSPAQLVRRYGGIENEN